MPRFSPIRQPGNETLNRVQDALSRTLNDLDGGLSDANTSLSELSSTADSLDERVTALEAAVDNPSLAAPVTEYFGNGSIATGVHIARYTGTGGHILNLPAANAEGAGIGQILQVLHEGTGKLTLSRVGTDTINDHSGTSLVLHPQQHAYLASNGTGKWAAIVREETPDARRRVVFEADFLSASVFSCGLSSTGSTGTLSIQPVANNRPGVLQCSVSNSGQVAGVRTDAAAIVIGGARWRYTTWLRLNSTLSDAVDSYEVFTGLGDTLTGDGHTDMIGWFYNHAINGGRWTARCYNGVAPITSMDSGQAAALNTWYRLEFEVNEAGTAVEFFIDGTSAGSISTKIPTGTANALGIVPVVIEKTAGVNPRTVQSHGFRLPADFTTAR